MSWRNAPAFPGGEAWRNEFRSMTGGDLELLLYRAAALQGVAESAAYNPRQMALDALDIAEAMQAAAKEVDGDE